MGVGIKESVQHPPTVIIAELGEIKRSTQQQLDVLMLVEAVDAVKRMATRKGIENHRQDHGARIHLHVARDQLVDGVDQIDAFRESPHDRKVVHIADFNLLRVEHAASPAFDERKQILKRIHTKERRTCPVQSSAKFVKITLSSCGM